MGKPSGSTIIANSQSPKEEIAKALAARGGSPALDVRSGSKADVTAFNHDVRFTPESRHEMAIRDLRSLSVALEPKMSALGQ
jgi:hypothetical protein